MKKLLLILFFSSISFGQEVKKELCEKPPLKVAVIDTGFGYKDAGHEATLCKFGHYDFTTYKKFTNKYGTVDPLPVDNHGHGTNIAGIIDGFAKAGNINYCLVIIKYYDPNARGSDNLKATVRSIRHAIDLGVDYINYSGGGLDFSNLEKTAVLEFLDKGGTFVAAAGNEFSDMDKKLKYYPAFYDERVISVGNAKILKGYDLMEWKLKQEKTKKEMRVYLEGQERPVYVRAISAYPYISQQDVYAIPANSSNYGNIVKRWEVGENIMAFGETMSGTSQAAALATGKILVKTHYTYDNYVKRACN